MCSWLKYSDCCRVTAVLCEARGQWTATINNCDLIRGERGAEEWSQHSCNWKETWRRTTMLAPSCTFCLSICVTDCFPVFMCGGLVAEKYSFIFLHGPFCPIPFPGILGRSVASLRFPANPSKVNSTGLEFLLASTKFVRKALGDESK